VRARKCPLTVKSCRVAIPQTPSGKLSEDAQDPWSKTVACAGAAAAVMAIVASTAGSAKERLTPTGDLLERR
jgi:hypothetical protein